MHLRPARHCLVVRRNFPINHSSVGLAASSPENLFVQARIQLSRLSTIAPPGGGARELRYPVIVIDAGERPISISPALRTALGLGPDGPPPGTLRAIMDEASVWRVHAALRYGRATARDALALTLVAPDGRSQAAAAEFLPTTEGGAVLVVSLEPGPWSGEDAALLLDHSQDLVFSVRLQPAFSFRYVNAASAPITGYGSDELRADPSVFAEAIHPDDRDSPRRRPRRRPTTRCTRHLPVPPPRRRVALVRALRNSRR